MKKLKINKELFEVIMNDLPEQYKMLKEVVSDEMVECLGMEITGKGDIEGLKIELDTNRKTTDLVEESSFLSTIDEELEGFLNIDTLDNSNKNLGDESKYDQKKKGVIAVLEDLKPELTREQLEERADTLLTIIKSINEL